jgi:hypothetical protein
MATGYACAAARRSLPAKVAPLLMPHLAAVTDMLKQLYPAAAAMLDKSAAAGGQTASADVVWDDCGSDSLTGTYGDKYGQEKQTFCRSIVTLATLLHNSTHSMTGQNFLTALLCLSTSRPPYDRRC